MSSFLEWPLEFDMATLFGHVVHRGNLIIKRKKCCGVMSFYGKVITGCEMILQVGMVYEKDAMKKMRK